MSTVYDHIRVEPKRDRWGRYLIKGQPYTRVTTFAEAVDDRYNLEKWKQRMTALGLVDRHDLYAQIASTHRDDRKALDRLCDQAVEAAKGSAGANLGTALHRFTERIDRGEEGVAVPPPWDADIAAYRRTLDSNGVHVDPAMVERIVVRHDLGIAGTFDRLVTIDGYDLPLIGDVKTGATLDFSWGGIAIQLACYANADELYDPASDSLHPAPKVDGERALVIHLPAGRGECALYVVDIVAGWEAAQCCRTVRDWRRRKDLASPFTPADPAAVKRSWLIERIAWLRDTHPDTLDTLRVLWPPNVPTLRDKTDHTLVELDAIAVAVSHTEAQHRVAFPDTVAPDGAVPQAAVDAAVGRLRALPADLLETVTVDAKAAGVPNLRSGNVTAAHLATVDTLLDAAEAEAKARLWSLDAALERVCEDDQELRGALLTAVHVDRPPTQDQVDAIAAVVTAVDAQVVAFACDDAGVWRVSVDVDRLKELFGDGRVALAAVKELADTYGYDRPRSLADAAANPALIALAATRASTPTHNSTEAA